jgi:hypothetical protein
MESTSELRGSAYGAIATTVGEKGQLMNTFESGHYRRHDTGVHIYQADIV